MADGQRIPTNLRTLMILEILGRSDRAMTATEINESLGLPKQTVHRLCTTLEQTGFLTRQGKTKRFQTARRLRDMGAGLLFNSRAHISRRQILLDVARQVKETVNFVVPDDSGMSYVDRVETDWMFRIQLPIGSHVPFHCTASGKCFLATLPPKARRAFVSSLTLTQMTPQTKTETDLLLKDLRDISHRGYSLDEQEFFEGLIAIAVPVTDAAGRFVAALAFHGPTQRMSVADAIARRGILQEAALRLRAALFEDA